MIEDAVACARPDSCAVCARDDNEDKLRESKAALGDADYGDDGARWALRDKCVEKTLQGYVYEVCFYKNARQGSTRLGDYRSTEGSVLTYDGGEYCWNGPARSLGGATLKEQ